MLTGWEKTFLGILFALLAIAVIIAYVLVNMNDSANADSFEELKTKLDTTSAELNTKMDTTSDELNTKLSQTSDALSRNEATVVTLTSVTSQTAEYLDEVKSNLSSTDVNVSAIRLARSVRDCRFRYRERTSTGCEHEPYVSA